MLYPWTFTLISVSVSSSLIHRARQPADFSLSFLSSSFVPYFSSRNFFLFWLTVVKETLGFGWFLVQYVNLRSWKKWSTLDSELWNCKAFSPRMVFVENWLISEPPNFSWLVLLKLMFIVSDKIKRFFSSLADYYFWQYQKLSIKPRLTYLLGIGGVSSETMTVTMATAGAKIIEKWR